MTTFQKITNFVKQVKARLKQDDDELVILKNQRKVDSALSSQIAALKNKEVDLETEAEDAQEELTTVKYPIALITDGKAYIQDVVKAKEKLERAQSALLDVRDSIKFFKELQEENNQEVES